MSVREDILNILKGLKLEIAQRYKVKGIGLFGSCNRGEQAETSDIDLLVDFEEGADLFDLVALAQFLEDKLRRKVDLVSRHGLREELREQVLKDVAML